MSITTILTDANGDETYFHGALVDWPDYDKDLRNIQVYTGQGLKLNVNRNSDDKTFIGTVGIVDMTNAQRKVNSLVIGLWKTNVNEMYVWQFSEHGQTIPSPSVKSQIEDLLRHGDKPNVK